MSKSIIEHFLSKHSRIWEMVFCLLAASLSLPLAINGIFIIATIVLWTVTLYYRKLPFIYLKNRLVQLLIAFFFIHVIGLAYSENLNYGLQYLERLYTIFAFPFVVCSLANGQMQIRKNVLMCFSLSVITISSLYLFFDEAMLDEILTVNRTYQGIYLLFCFAILLFYTFLTPGSKSRPGLLILIAYTIFLLANTGSKMPIFIFPAILIVFFMFYYRSNKKIVLPLIIVFSSITIIAGFALNNEVTSQRLRRLFNDRFDYIRYRNWKANLSVIQDHPIFGVGTGDGLIEVQKKRESWWHEYIFEYNSHNQYLETTIRLGLIGLVILLLCFYLPFQYGLKKGDFILVSFIIIFSVSCLTESLLHRQKGIIFFSFFTTFLLSTSGEKHFKKDTTQV